jgi:GAF domain-containing protein
MLVLIVLPLRFAVRNISEGFERARRDEEVLRERNLELESIRSNLVERTRELEHRTDYLEATADVAREAASILDFNELAREIVDLISDRFGFYHAGLFLVDQKGEWATLEAASSPGGQRMLARGHRLRVGQEGIVGYVTGQGEARIALDVGEDAAYFDNPDMPETRSEMALPLMARGEIIGALDVQSKQPQAFSDEDIAVLQTMATQIALAISNARLFQRVQANVDAERRAYGQISRKDWQRIVQSRSQIGYRYEQGNISPLDGPTAPSPAEDLPKIEIPIRVRGQVIGTINAHKANPDETWSDEENSIMSTLAEQMGEALESARLYENTQQRAMREQMLSEATDKMRRATDIDALMKTAVQEMASILGTSNAFVQFTGQTGASNEAEERKSQ